MTPGMLCCKAEIVATGGRGEADWPDSVNVPESKVYICMHRSASHVYYR